MTPPDHPAATDPPASVDAAPVALWELDRQRPLEPEGWTGFPRLLGPRCRRGLLPVFDTDGR